MIVGSQTIEHKGGLALCLAFFTSPFLHPLLRPLLHPLSLKFGFLFEGPPPAYINY